MSERCVNDFMGFCDPNAEYAVKNCPFGRVYVEEYYNWHLERGEKVVDKMPTLILHEDWIKCTAKPKDLIEIHDDCICCDGVPEYDGEFACCPVEYPDECPYHSSKEGAKND